MCTIFAYNGRRLSKDDVVSMLSRSCMRGPDDERIEILEDGTIMAFQRLAIMGPDKKGMQPFSSNRYIAITNGEIYGFRKIKEQLTKEGFSFKSDSDCELLIPLYMKYGTDIFKMLDAEYACVLYDKNTASFIAARDTIGIRPLFYGYDEDGAIAFASEARILQGFVKKIIPFPPGTYYKDNSFIKYRDIGSVEEKITGSMEEITKGIRQRLIQAVEKRLDSDTPIGFLLSGGLDSSLVCSIASRLQQKPIRTFAIGMKKDAIDLKYAKQTADYLKTEHTEIIVDDDDIKSSLEDVIYCLATYDITTIRASLGMYLVCKAIHNTTDIKVLLTGEVSDELFGYKYTDFAPSAEEFQNESAKRMHELYAYDVLRADRCISDNSMEARVPFSDVSFASYVMAIDPEMKMNRYNMGKYLLRKAFDLDGYLPNDILYREKAAFSDAVGHSMVNGLKAYAEDKYKDRDWKAMCMCYPKNGRPFTPESLLYRQIFEKYYPGQSDMIPGFWMPNPAWPGCNVSDPSARVLSNYGKSGE